MKNLGHAAPVFLQWFRRQPFAVRKIVGRAITKTGGVYYATGIQRINGKQKGPGFINTQLNYNGSYED